MSPSRKSEHVTTLKFISGLVLVAVALLLLLLSSVLAETEGGSWTNGSVVLLLGLTVVLVISGIALLVLAIKEDRDTRR